MNLVHELPDPARPYSPLFGMVIILVGLHVKGQRKCSLECGADGKPKDLRPTDKRTMRCRVGVANVELQSACPL